MIKYSHLAPFQNRGKAASCVGHHYLSGACVIWKLNGYDQIRKMMSSSFIPTNINHNVKLYHSSDEEIIVFENRVEEFSKKLFMKLPFPLFDQEGDAEYDHKSVLMEVIQHIIYEANENELFLSAARDGIIKGYKEAERMWGEEQSLIAKKVLSISLEFIDVEIKQIHFSKEFDCE
jgi:hypothetical protein